MRLTARARIYYTSYPALDQFAFDAPAAAPAAAAAAAAEQDQTRFTKNN